MKKPEMSVMMTRKKNKASVMSRGFIFADSSILAH
jgi:hypothetical protein